MKMKIKIKITDNQKKVLIGVLIGLIIELCKIALMVLFGMK